MAQPPKDEKKSKRQAKADFDIPVEHGSEELESSGDVTISPPSGKIEIEGQTPEVKVTKNEKSISSQDVTGSGDIQVPLIGVSGTGYVSSPEVPSSDQLPPRNVNSQIRQSPDTSNESATVDPPKHHAFEGRTTVTANVDATLTFTPSKATQSAINDTASGTDVIGFKSYVKAMARLITNSETQTPLTIGLYGDWGSGKSSFMEQVRKEISEIAGMEGQISSVNQVWFNAWKYETQGQLWAALIGEITSNLEKEKGLSQIMRNLYYRGWHEEESIKLV